MESCKAVETPMQTKEKFFKDDGSLNVAKNLYISLIGCLMYLTTSRSDIVQVVSLLFRFMHCASEEHMQVAERIFRYVKENVNYGIKYAKTYQFQMVGFSDSDWTGSVDDMKSTIGFCFSLGSGVISWCSKK